MARPEKTKRSVQRIEPQVIGDAVNFLLAPSNIYYYSWGFKSIRIGGEAIHFPAIVRRRSRSHLMDSYVSHILNTGATKYLKRSTFYSIMSKLTAGDARAWCAVDYVVGFLINDPANLMKRMINEVIVGDDTSELRTTLTDELDMVVAYLKYGLDNLSTHDPTTFTVCQDCCRALKFFDSLKSALLPFNPHPTTLQVVDDCSKKARLYMGHRLRVLNQQKAISDILEGMRERCDQSGFSDEAMVTLDFKMKLEPLYYREKTVDHYGKRGISWHGALVQYYEYDPDASDPSKRVVNKKLYYDHICKDDSKQDKESVISLLETILMRIKTDLPHIRRITLQSDNATCYQNMLIPFVMPFLSLIHGVRLDRFVHTETQDGKGILDAHFARSMGVIRSWVREHNNCITPTQAVIALKSNGGLPNCAVELVEHNRAKLGLLSSKLKHMEDFIRRHMKRANDVQVTMDIYAISAMTRFELHECPEFQLTFWDYSGIGSSLTFLCDPASMGICVLSASPVSVLDESIGGDDEDEDEDAQAPSNEKEDDELAALTEDERDDEVCSTDEIQPRSWTGPATGVQVATQGQLVRRTRKWRTQPVHAGSVMSGTCSARNAVSTAIKMAVQMQQSGDLVIRNPQSESVFRNDRYDQTPVSDSFARGWQRAHRKGKRMARDMWLSIACILKLSTEQASTLRRKR